MIEKIKIVERLLACNDHAVLPGFGGFVVQHQSAIITDTSIIPSQLAVSFNPLLKHNDGMFIVELSRLEQISYKEASRKTALFIHKIVQTLEENQSLDFGTIGKFQKNSDGQVEFTPNTLVSFLPTNFGLNEVFFPKNKDEKRHIKLNIPTNKIMRYAAILVTFIALFFSANLNKSDFISQADFSNLLKFELPEVTITSNTESTETEQVNLQKSEHVRFAYKLVVATFQTQEKASSYMEELKASLYPEAEIVVSKSNTKVVIKSFNNIIAAVNYMEEVKHTDQQFADAWVMKSDPSLN